jgi:DNA invertase Pin-like site-specific DNA recombinase
MRSGPLRFVAYYRVSTDRQGRSGLGLEAQREAVARYIAGQDGQGGELVAAFEEIESGKRSDRPQLAAALAACRAMHATLLIARLDRLSRDAHFLLGLQKASVPFTACDMPHADHFVVGVLALVAQKEREMISDRTRAALAAARARGVRLGNPRLRPGSPQAAARASQAKAELAVQRAADVRPVIEQARKAGASSLGEIAAALTARGIRTPLGKTRWRPVQVQRVLAKTGAAVP